MSKSGAILVIGNEILSGKTRDENSPFLATELRDLGVDVRRIVVVPDEVDVVAAEVRHSSKTFDYVFTTGGVGPTHDDVTMEAIALGLGHRIVRNAQFEAAIRGYYAPELVEANLRMADIPEAARLIGAPGLWFPVVVVENAYIFPGVPEILRRKFAHIREMFRDAPFHLHELFLRADEGLIARSLHQVLEHFPELLLGSYPYFDNRPYTIKLTLESKDLSYLEAARRMLVEKLEELGVGLVSPVREEESKQTLL